MATIVTPAHGCMHDDIEIIPMTGAVHCTNCGMWWYDANAYVFTHPGRSEATPNTSQEDKVTQEEAEHLNDWFDITADDYPEDWEDKADHTTKLNPDNEPTSETNQWKEQDNG